MPPTATPEPTTFRETVCGWLEAEGWTFADEERGLPAGHPAEREFRWIAVAHGDVAPLIVAEPSSTPHRLVLSHHYALGAVEWARVDRLGRDEQAQLAWDLLSHLNLLQVDYEVDGPVPHEVLLTVSITHEGLTRDRLQRRLLRLGAALRLVSLAFAKALGTLLDRPASLSVH